MFSNNTELTRQLVERGADVNVRVYRDSHHFNVVSQSSAHHFNVRSEDRAHYSYLLHYVAQRGSSVEHLLRHLLNAPNIDVNARDSHGRWFL